VRRRINYEERPPHSHATPNLSVDEERQAVWERLANAALQPVGGDRVGEATSAVVPGRIRCGLFIDYMTIGRRSY